MVLPSLLASPSATTNSPTSRMRRGTGRGNVILPPSRPPVLLQIMESTILAGTVAEAAPKRVFPYSKSKREASLQQSAEALYRFWAPLLQEVYDNLGQDTKDRRAVVLVPDATLEQDYIQTKSKECILRVLLDVIGVPSVHLQPALQFLPFAFPMLSTLTVVHLSETAACTFVHSKDQSLPYTFQSVPLEEESDDISIEWNPALQRQYLDASYPHSVLVALLKTMEDCPLPIRGEAIRNLVFAGEGVLYRPDLPLRVTKRLKQILQQGKLPDEEQDGTLEQETTTTGPYPAVLGMVPVDLPNLKALAPSVGLIDTTATVGPYRADLLVWIGATLWASHSHQHNPDAFSWISNNDEE